MSIECKVVLTPAHVNAALRELGLPPAHKVDARGVVEPVAAGASVLEHNDLRVAMLGRFDDGGAANILLMLGDRREPYVVPLALLEHVVEAMRDRVGPDPRLVSTGEAENDA